MTTDLEIERIFREEHGRVVASLIRRFGDIDLAEDAAAEALLAAVDVVTGTPSDRVLGQRGHDEVGIGRDATIGRCCGPAAQISDSVVRPSRP